MKTLNNNAIMVLRCVTDKKNGTGISAIKATKKEIIVNRSKLSPATVDRALKVLIKEELIKEGIKEVNKKTYYVTQEGLNMIRIVKGR